MRLHGINAIQDPNKLVEVPTNGYLLPITRASRHCHELGFQVPHSTKEFHKFSFYPRTIREWNALPTHIPGSGSLESFKSNLAIWSNNTI